MGPSASYSITVRLTNALRVAGKKLPEVRVAMAGAGAAGTAVLKLLLGAGASAGDIVVCDDRGAVHLARPRRGARRGHPAA